MTPSDPKSGSLGSRIQSVTPNKKSEHHWNHCHCWKAQLTSPSGLTVTPEKAENLSELVEGVQDGGAFGHSRGSFVPEKNQQHVCIHTHVCVYIYIYIHIYILQIIVCVIVCACVLAHVCIVLIYIAHPPPATAFVTSSDYIANIAEKGVIGGTDHIVYIYIYLCIYLSLSLPLSLSLSLPLSLSPSLSLSLPLSLSPSLSLSMSKYVFR